MQPGAPALAISAGDTAWVLASAALVMLMLPGLALFYGGLVRSKNSLNTLAMSMAPLGIVSVQWVIVGYALAFGTGSSLVGGLQWAGFAGVGAVPNGDYAATIPHAAFAMFQVMFAAITVALISGAVVERMKFPTYLLFVLAWTTLIYDPLAHWVWGTGGWLRTLGALDFAGGTVVHISAGTSALVCAIMLGRRRDVGRATLVPHNVPFTVIGAGLLWFGWFGFNAGSALAANGLAGSAFVATHTAAAAAMTAWMLLDLVRTKRTTAVGMATGAVIGLVAITPAAGFVTPLAAVAVGAIGAAASYGAMQLRSRFSARLDDALDVFACHGVAGIVGALLTGVFATKAVNPAGADGLLAGNPGQLGVQAIAVVATMLFCGGVTAAIVVALKATVGLRVPLADELTGLDWSEHGEEAYRGGGLDDLSGGADVISGSVVIAQRTASMPKTVEGLSAA
ncbi:ammonium transporter (plasmid) [Gemmatirosa kalamazoonensis]|uniref:Ammonium transporter n=1 Tax=Gemmatirosa kalamazoonensis TaxID=861299 RepID=W0RT12_9BACT|nr:ammonium transporter [Gemmatirosa kalamazoonensis]AHG93826.1 ammonium transporter [Gemmatirosa kalamazoonensis]